MTATVTHNGSAVLALRRVAAVTVRHLYVIRRSPHRIFDIAVWPVVDSILYGSIAAYIRQTNASPGAARTALLVVSGIILWHVVYQSQIAVSTSFFEDAYSRQLPAMFATPLRPIEWVTGAALQGMVKVTTGVTAVAVSAALLYHFNIIRAGPGIVPVMGLLLLSGWAFAVIAIGLGLLLGSGSEALAWGLLFVILPLSGALYPVSALPPVIRPISEILPITHTFAAGRTVEMGRPVPWGEIGVAAGATTALVAVALGVATLAVYAFRRNGSVSRYL